MHPGQLSLPIPESAQFDDPVWAGRFQDLANQMVLLSAKPKLISRYTGLTAKAISDRYQRLTGHVGSPGRLPQSQPKHYAIPHSRAGLDWTVQSAAFASIYLKLERAFEEPVNRGWLLVTAFQAYQRLTDPLQRKLPRLCRINFNNAYDLVTHLRYGISRKDAPLALQNCSSCGTSYLVITELELDHQSCPMCAIQARYRLLVENSERISATRQASAAKKARHAIHSRM